MPAANTKDCFRELIGRTVIAVLFDTLPLGNLNHGTKTLVLDDGTGLTVNASGAYWRESQRNIADAVKARTTELQRARDDLEEVLRADRVLPLP